MKKNDQGILLQRTAYSDSSVVLRVFTRSEGVRAFLFQGAKKKKGVQLLPLLPVEMEFYQRSATAMPMLTALAPLHVYSSCYASPVKSSVVFFQNEVLLKLLEEGAPDERLFTFMLREMALLNDLEQLNNYLFAWLLKLIAIEGLQPLPCDGLARCFDFKEGRFSSYHPGHQAYYDGPEVTLLEALFKVQEEAVLSYPVPKLSRKELLKQLLAYLAFHYPRTKQLNALEILEVVFDD